jgi:hypothetical protein
MIALRCLIGLINQILVSGRLRPVTKMASSGLQMVSWAPAHETDSRDSDRQSGAGASATSHCQRRRVTAQPLSQSFQHFDSLPTPDAPVAFLESRRGMPAICVCDRGSEPAGLNDQLTVPAHPRHYLLGPSAADIHGWKTSTLKFPWWKSPRPMAACRFGWRRWPKMPLWRLYNG